MQTVVFDIEVYRNYFLAAFKSLDTGKVLTFERTEAADFDRDRLEKVLRRCRTVGFNSRNYDLPITWLALRGFPLADLKRASDEIILNNARPWEVERAFNCRVPANLDHIDLIEVAPGQASLKIYGGRLHAPRMQDLPFDPNQRLGEHEVEALRDYCVNDLATTEILYDHLRPQLELRASMSTEYGQDLRSKSDAQIAEAVIKSRVGQMTGHTPERPTIPPGTRYRYRVPDYIRFRTPELRALLDAVRAAEFVVSPTGKVEMPEALAKARIALGGSVYRLGIGGLHSSEQSVAHVADENTILCDRDVASYYPAIIMNLGLYPKHMGGDFLEVYRGIVDRRLKAKRDGDKVTADSLKITINGSFGKFGSKWSALYSPNLLIQTTVTGQLALLLLIEMLEAAGIPVVSANTDGLVIKCPRAREGDMNALVAEWEKATAFETEETRYAALYSRDVNNYVAVYEKPKNPAEPAKTKGAYAPPGLQKNPTNQICVTAALARITAGTPVEETIRACRDIRQFVTVRAVKGGAVAGLGYLGKAVRWYYSTRARGQHIEYASNGNKVARTDGAEPLMDLPAEFPDDVDYDWYVREANDILADIGFLDRPAPARPIRKNERPRLLLGWALAA